MKVRYRFTGQAGGRYYWQSVKPVAPGDSRYEQVSCRVDWFWGQSRFGRPLRFTATGREKP